MSPELPRRSFSRSKRSLNPLPHPFATFPVTDSLKFSVVVGLNKADDCRRDCSLCRRRYVRGHSLIIDTDQIEVKRFNWSEYNRSSVAGRTRTRRVLVPEFTSYCDGTNAPGSWNLEIQSLVDYCRIDLRVSKWTN